MKKVRKLLWCCLSVLAVNLSCSKVQDRNEETVASIDDFQITRQDFIQQFERLHGPDSFEKADETAKRAVLKDMIKEQITLFEAYRLGINNDEKILAVAREKERELAAKALRKREVEDAIITEALLQQYYRWSGSELDIEYMKFFAGDTETGKAAARKKADDILQQLANGASFKVLAARFSEHDAAKTDSGKIGTIDCYTPLEGFFERAYPLQEGGVSDPFLAGHSIWIVKTNKKIPVELKPYQAMRAEILDKVRDLYGDKIAKRNIAFNNELLAEYHFAPSPENIDLFCQRAKGIKSIADTAGQFTAKEKLLPLSTNDIESTTIGGFLPKVISYYVHALDQQRTVNMLLSDFSINRLLKHKAMQLQMNEKSPAKEEYQSWLVYFLKKSVVQRQVIDKMDLSDAVLKPIYEQNRPSYFFKKQATVQEIFRTSKADIDLVYQLAAAGQNFAALQKKYCQNKENSKNGLVGPFPIGMNGQMGDLAFSGMKIGEISLPFPYRGGYSIFKLLDLEPERIKSFAEAKEEVKTAYIQAHWEQNVAAWIERAKKNYSIKLHL
jgi:parvulin-like peptidyl-prolyl isomerase